MTEVMVLRQVTGGGDAAGVKGSAAAQPVSVVQYRLGGRMVNFWSDPRCKVCNSEYRFKIEEGVILGRGYPTILNSVPESQRMSLSSLRRHVENHMPADTTVARTILEQHTKEMGQAVLAVEGTLIDHRSFWKNVLRRSHENIEAFDGRAVTVEHGLAAAQRLAELDALAGANVDQAAYAEAVRTFFVELRPLVSDEVMADFADALRRNPLLRALMSGEQNAQVKSSDRLSPEDDDIEDAEVISSEDVASP